jgi:hypothetical protein
MPWSSARLLVCVATVSVLAIGLSACGGGGGGGGGSGTGGGGSTTPPNPPPVLGTLTFSTKEGTNLSAQVTATDPAGETITLATTSNPSHGTLTSFSANGSFVYQPTAGVTGTDSFGVQATDAGGNVVSGTVTITLKPNHAPVAANDVMRADGAALDSINVLSNDSDADGDKLTVSIEGTALVGTTSVNADSTVRISGLPGGFKGVTRFKYRITVPRVPGRGTSGVSSVYVLNVGAPTTLTKVSPVGAASAARLRFSSDSQSLYFLASTDAAGANKSLYLVSPANPIAPTAVSALSSPNTNDDVIDYRISPDQARVVLQANRGGRVGLYFVDARQLQTEVQISHALAFGEVISDSTLSRNGGTVSGAPLQRVAYTVKTLLGAFNTYVADVSATPNARLIANGTQAVGLSPSDSALLYSKGLQIWENSIGAGTADALVEAGSDAWYDSTGNVVLVRQFLPSGGSPSSYPALVVTTRGTFGSSLPLGTPGLAADYMDVSGFDRPVVIVGEGPTTGAMPTSPRLALINALAPEKLFYLADKGSPQQLTSPSVRVVAAN